MTFSVNGKDSKFTSYIIKSNKFPQQTSLLGMLRFLILRNDTNVFDIASQRIKDGKRGEASGLIGPESFKKTGKENNYGKIIKLYPCFLQKDGKNLDFLAKDAKNLVSFGDVVGVVNGVPVSVPDKIEGYDPKDGIRTLYEVEGVEMNEDDIFVEDVCNGINRNIKTGKVEDDALFKQVSYRLKPGFSFAFYAEVECNLEAYNGQVVSVGGDSSQFIIGIKAGNMKQNANVENGTKVVLTSPAYIPDLSSVKYAIADTIPFKCMCTETSTVESYNKRNKLYGYSDKLMLYTSGSVFYAKDSMLKDLKNVIEKQEDFRQIGYNHYIVK